MGVALVVLLAFTVRLVYVQVVIGPSLALAAEGARTQSHVTMAHRGDITDADGVVLATSIDRYTVSADQKTIPEFVPSSRHTIDGKKVEGEGAVALARLLAPILDRSAPELAAQLSGTNGRINRNVILKKDVVPEVQRQIVALGVSAYIRTKLTTERTYPAGTTAGNIVGYVGAQQSDDGTTEQVKGLGGVEATYDDLLTGTPGSESFQRAGGASGVRIPGSTQQSVEAVPGDSVALTLVRDIGWKAQDSIDKAVAETGADYGIAVVQDVRTQEILALADSGAIDPNDRSDSRVADGSRAVKDVFAPGSTGKVITMAAVIEEGLASPESRYEVDYTYTTSNGETFRDSHYHGLENLTLAGVLAESSNTGTVMVGQDLPKQTREDYLRAFGLGAKTGLGLPGESAGLLAPAASWDGRTEYAVLFGQGLAVNAVQATSVFSTIANGGKRVTPTLLKGTTGPDGVFVPAPDREATQVVSESTADQVLHMMEAVVEEGSGAAAAIDGYRVAGKTGTAEEVGADGRLTDIMASFIGVAPADDPRYTVSVFLKNPRTNIFGGLVAAPVFKDVMGFTLQHMNVPPSSRVEEPYPTTW
ncbi:penicillin-binding protein 2 [Oerskovia sp. Sa1BUA8]|uniref:Penicillin-binding protein 2 n=1 Tax=Oerskovia douganii TaxID=2762210 RepID=A0A9D5U6A5_9CELL|nr:penicillin-binding protein 2 [Oerskovia douganii]MBE7698940.1 penicillin-binding protein 2 [Oerskovia douganii]